MVSKKDLEKELIDIKLEIRGYCRELEGSINLNRAANEMLDSIQGANNGSIGIWDNEAFFVLARDNFQPWLNQTFDKLQNAYEKLAGVSTTKDFKKNIEHYISKISPLIGKAEAHLNDKNKASYSKTTWEMKENCIPIITESEKNIEELLGKLKKV